MNIGLNFVMKSANYIYSLYNDLIKFCFCEKEVLKDKSN